MPTFDNANSVQGTSVANLTTGAWTIAGTNRLLVASMVWSAGSPPNYSTMKWEGSGGTALTQNGSTLAVGANMKLALARLIAPNAASGTLYGELSGATDEFCIGGVSVTDAHQTVPLGTAATATGSGASPQTATVNVSSAADELVIDVAGATQSGSGTVTFAVGAGQNMRWEQESIGGFSAGTQSTEVGSGTTTMSEVATASASGPEWGIIAVPIKPAVAASRPMFRPA